MLLENTSLESLAIQRENIKVDEYVKIVTTLQHNRTLKSLKFHPYKIGTIRLTDDEDKQMAKILKKNYALESLPDFYQKDLAGDADAILRLNAAGRRYLIEDGSSITKGVKVLGAVCSDINCVFLHLLENPRLCDRSAVEVASESTREVGGKRARRI
jgi:hypothetical protein